ncbi:LacI family DNA-binding transcriptional regulator [Actinocrispum wychmicini]|uniref:DNA-binding LacI/PurR family transcriptional regulator n=1 Tax=Actinocrispum wychmicini TaxID=1213861 RepID=A0A4R2JNI4_9PSEU|nr:LacI family DNA-binding transcriptional regulator [Actinocrispum wychmicini]TCO58249.1 DNA-binding LacI/PurR family transcriptional regulator [Actinocrispum wychmicini]
MKRPTIGDIARRAGVSKAAVSYALNGRPGVSEETRERVSRIAHALGWRANTAALALSAERAGVVGLVVAGPAPWAMVEGIERELAVDGVALQVAIVRDTEAEAETYRDWWAARRVDGVLVIDPRSDDPRIPLLRKLNVPAVLVGAHAPDMSAVVDDPVTECRRAVEHLIERGHRKLGHVAGRAELCRNAHRREALWQVSQELLGVVPVATGGDLQATRALLARPDRPSALIYDEETAAATTVAHASVLNLRIPTELAVVAWGDSAVCQLVHPGVTAIRHDDGAAGTFAARLLLNHLKTGIPEQRLVGPGELVIRGTT